MISSMSGKLSSAIIFIIAIFFPTFFSFTFVCAKKTHFGNLEFNLSGLDLFAYNSESKSLQLVETRKLNVSWYVYTHESRLVLLASGMQCKTFTGFQVCVPLILWLILFKYLTLLSWCIKNMDVELISVVTHGEFFINWFQMGWHSQLMFLEAYVKEKWKIFPLFFFFGYRILDSLSCSFKSTVLVCSNYGNLREIQKQFPSSVFLNLKFTPDYIESHTLCTCL